MPLDTSGALLEGVRISEGNNPFTFPPRSLVSDPSLFAGVSSRAEYALVVHSTDPSRRSLEIADPELRFRWTRNEPGVLRFSYDSFGKRWLPSPGGPPDELGPLSNEDRLTMPVPDPSLADAPFSVYVGKPVRQVTFSVSVVGNSGDFAPPGLLPPGTVQVSSEDGSMNFSQADVDEHGGRTVLSQRQSFFDRTKVSGRFGTLPESSSVDYFLFLNPRPASGQTPLVRIGYGLHLSAVEVPDEGSLGTPSPGTFAWSVDTGRVRFSPSDVDSGSGEGAYYDGVSIGVVAPSVTPVGPVSAWPSVAFSVPLDGVGFIDQRFVVYAEMAGVRSYWNVSLSGSAPSSRPKNGTAVVDTSTGDVYLSSRDVSRFSGWSFFYLDSVMHVEDGVSFQAFRSGVNGSGVEQAPDFTVLYLVEDQIVVDGITGSPFVMLPTTPVVDDVLELRVDQGPSSSGTFTGRLSDGRDPGDPGMGYLLNLDAHQMSFCLRRPSSLTLRAPTPSVKLPDAAISELGFELTEDGSPVVPGSGFGFDSGTGLLSFTEPVGVNGPSDVDGVQGTAVVPSFFESGDPVFGPDSPGMYLLTSSGPNVGIRVIESVVEPTKVSVSPPWVFGGAESPDLRSTADVLADRFWAEVDPPFKKFSLASALAGSPEYAPMAPSEFSVFSNVGQVNLKEPADPGESFLVSYIALVTDDDGATYTPEPRTERALFKVRQESASPTGDPNVFSFNPAGRPVSLSRPISVYVAGVPLGPDFFEFQAPGTVRLADPAGPDDAVVLDYWVEVALGGETSFDLLSEPIDVDFASVSAGSSSAVFNGDQTGTISAGSAMLVSGRELLLVASSVYDPAADTTAVSFTAPAVYDSEGGPILSCAPLGEGYVVPEPSGAGSFVYGSNSFSVSGDAVSRYRSGTLVLVDGDPYHVSASLLQGGSTRVTTSAPARRNYIIPSVSRSVRPVFSPGSSFQTSRQANLDFDFQLVRNGPRAALLVRGIDYSVSGGGMVELSEAALFGDSLYALYVAQDPRAAGTVFGLNYSHAVAPSQQNGLLGQRLVATYNLYAPDSFFFRVETVLTFLPEVQDMLRSESQSTSGPNTGDAVGMSNKDFGRASPYYDEQHEGNLDVEISRLLLFYNDLVNLYEDLLANLDGRVVGGRSGRFRFDDRFDNPPRSGYSEVTNDIDDRVLLYSRLRLTGFYTFEEVPVYGSMAVPNSLSRIFPTAGIRPTALNDKTGVLDFGKTMGSIGVGDLRSVGMFRSSRSGSFFSSVSGSTFLVDTDGEAELNVPRFQVGEDVQVYEDDGAPVGPPLRVLSISGSGPYSVTLSSGAPILRGSLLKDLSDPDNPTNHFYQPGRDLSVDNDSGQVSNMYLGVPLLFPQTEVEGNEVCDVPVTFGNSEVAPRRVPVLDGGTLDDDGTVPAPRLRYLNESSLLADEVSVLGNLGSASTVAGTGMVAGSALGEVFDSNLLVFAGDLVVFTSGPNSGSVRQVVLVISPSHFSVDSPFPAEDLSGSPVSSLSVLSVLSGFAPGVGMTVSFLSGPNSGVSSPVLSVPGSGLFRLSSPVSSPDSGINYFASPPGVQPAPSIVALELGVLSDNVPSAPVPPALIGTVGSEIRTAEAIAQYSGPVLSSGNGVASGSLLTDGTASFVLAGISTGCLVFVPSGPNRGLYRVLSVLSSTQLSVDSDLPYSAFPASVSTPYQVIRPESFVDGDQFGLVSQYLRETLAFYLGTLAWSASMGPAGAPARASSLSSRQGSVVFYVDSFSAALVDGGLYDLRYLWIDQRTNRRTGNFVRKRQAAERRAETLREIVADQKKLLVTQRISV